MTDPGRALETIVFERRNGVALITLNRPERLNAISRQLMTEVQGVLDEVEADAALGAVVLHGAGRAFCSGFDLKDDADAARSGVAAWREALQRDLDFMLRFWDFPKPTLAAVHGYCLAGGCELAMSCDITIADESARFGEPELKFGTTIINMIMPWLIGPKLTKELILSGEDRILPARAERIGLINKVVPKGAHLSEAMALAQRQIGPPITAMTLAFAIIPLSIGLALGRPIVRGLIRALLPPRLRSPLALLWTTHGLTPPCPTGGRTPADK